MQSHTVEICGDVRRMAEIEQMEAHLQCLLAGRVRELHLVWCDDGLEISGQARTYYAKQVAQAAVMACSHFPISRNVIEVK